MLQTLDISKAELLAADRYPISRWYVRPFAELVADRLADSWLRPSHVTVLGLSCGLAAAGSLTLWPTALYIAAIFVLLGWFCDRLDGALARRQRSASTWGAWLDANADELVDLGVHAAVAYASAVMTATAWPWVFYVAFVFGKYQLMHGLSSERDIVAATASARSDDDASKGPQQSGWVNFLYHLPANADVRLHLLVFALLTGWLQTELLVLALYYNARWVVRVGLVARRLQGDLS